MPYNIYLGTSGWSYNEWVGIFYDYPENKLQQYIKVFNTVEMDSTFYSYPNLSTTKSLAKIFPINYKLSTKMPNIITHKKLLGRLGNISSDIERFITVMDPLIKKGILKVILIQLPPGLKHDYKLLFSFLENLDYKIKYAIEFREPSWLQEDIFKLLEKFNVAYTIVDEPLLPPEIHVTADFAYIRWHGHGKKPWYNYWYSEDELRLWVPKIQELMDKVNLIFGYFNNHYRAYAVENCLRLLLMLGIINDRQKKILEKVRENILKPKATRILEQINADELVDKSVLELLFFLSDRDRIQRGVKIDRSQVAISITDEFIRAKVKDYPVIIDLHNKVITHNCADWTKISINKKLCKHVIRIFTLIPEERAKELLKDIIINHKRWQFKT